MARGSRGGGGGGSRGSFGGGSRGSFGGGSRGRRMSSSGGYYHHYHGPRYIHRYGFWGPRVYVTSGSYSAFSTIFGLFIMSLFFVFMFSCIAWSCADDVQWLQNEYDRYHTLIEAAETSGKTAQAEVTNYFYEAKGKYYIVYEYGYEPSFDMYLYEAESFATYTATEAASLVGKTITICYSGNTLDMWTDTIPQDFKNADIKNDGNYIEYKASVDTWNMVRNITIVVAVALFVGTIAVSKSAKENKEAVGESVSQNLSQPTGATTTGGTTTHQGHTYCAYCGSKLNSSDTKCPNCGSKVL